MLEHGSLETPIDRPGLQYPLGISFRPPGNTGSTGEIEIGDSGDQDFVHWGEEAAIFCQFSMGKPPNYDSTHHEGRGW